MSADVEKLITSASSEFCLAIENLEYNSSYGKYIRYKRKFKFLNWSEVSMLLQLFSLNSIPDRREDEEDASGCEDPAPEAGHAARDRVEVAVAEEGDDTLHA